MDENSDITMKREQNTGSYSKELTPYVPHELTHRPCYRSTGRMGDIRWVGVRDCNPGLEFLIPGFGLSNSQSRDPVGIGVVKLRLLKSPRGLRHSGLVCAIVLWILVL